MVKKVLFLLIIAFSIDSVFAQEPEEDVSVNTQFWLDYNTGYKLDDLKSVTGFIGYRSISPHIYDKFLLVPVYNFLNTKSPEFLKLDQPLIHSYHLGGGLYYTKNRDSEDDFEFRLMQGFKFFIAPIKSIPIKNYIRLEERFQKTFDGSNWTTAFRFRYKISTVIEWKKRLFNFNKGMYIPLNIEFFFNLKKADRFNDVIRISPGIGYKLNDDWKFEFYVSYHNTKNTTENESTSNDFVFRLRVYKISSKKKTSIKSKEDNLKELIE